jgi:enamine deaminase RidA (YjgF/YER057c/UK114 family)
LSSVWPGLRGNVALADHGPPSTLLGVSVLGFKGQLVEIEAVAARPR